MNDTHITNAAVEGQPETVAKETLLFVDDERNILASLRRLFRPLGYTILLAESGAKGLEIMATAQVDLIISDMRMPEMTGAQLLEKVSQSYPDTVRILLTGFSDIGSTIDAINKGKIYRYLSKPWDDNEITLTVRQALETKRLEREKRELQALTKRQNKELQDLNNNLELKVRQRTEELQQTADMLDLSFNEVKEAYHSILRVFAGLITMRESISGRSVERIADLAKRIALRMELPESQAEDIYYAGLLHPLGKLSLSDALVEQPPYTLGANALKEYQQHPVRAATALMPVEALQDVAQIIRSHEERWDSCGFPEALAGKKIPLGARILAVAKDFYGYQTGRVVPDRLSSRATLERMQAEAGRAYDADVVRALLVESGREGESQSMPGANERIVRCVELEVGMKLSRDLFSHKSTLLLSKGRVFSEVLIRKLAALERAEKEQYRIYIELEGAA